MNRTVCLGLSFALCLSLFVLPSSALSDSRIDPHGKEGMCHYCHRSKVVEEGKAGFRLNTVEDTCLDCHGERGSTLEDYLHRMLPHVKIKNKMIAYFKGRPDFSCQSCHYVMCQSHSRKQLQKRNPHIQLDKEGRIIEKACLFCHTIMPDYKHPDRKSAIMRYDISYLCSLCHVMSTQKKGLGFGEPMTEAMIRKKAEFEMEYDVSLPLGPNNTVVCASCHNPHQLGVMLRKKGYGSSSNKHRLVLEDTWMLCTACHLGRY